MGCDYVRLCAGVDTDTSAADGCSSSSSRETMVTVSKAKVGGCGVFTTAVTVQKSS